MFKLVKKLLGIIGVFKFTGVKEEIDKKIITHCVLYLIGLVVGIFIGYVGLSILI